MRILLVEDDTELAAALAEELRAAYIVDLCSTGKQALYWVATTAYDLVILDLGLPDISGFEVCSAIRKDEVLVPIMILTGESSIAEKVKALNLGADDYVVKPFHCDEILARVRALLRRGNRPVQHEQLKAGPVMLDRISREVFVNGKMFTLCRKEFDLLECLLINQPKIMNRQEILNQVWDSNADDLTKAIDVHISHLRKKIGHPLGSQLIETVYGLGYRINTR